MVLKIKIYFSMYMDPLTILEKHEGNMDTKPHKNQTSQSSSNEIRRWSWNRHDWFDLNSRSLSSYFNIRSFIIITVCFIVFGQWLHWSEQKHYDYLKHIQMWIFENNYNSDQCRLFWLLLGRKHRDWELWEHELK